MADITDELLESIQKDFNELVAKNEKIKRVNRFVKKGKATYKDANAYAIEIGDSLAQAFKKNLSVDVMPEGKMYRDMANRIMNETLGVNHNMIVELTGEVQTSLNKASGLNIKGVLAPKDNDRIKGFIERLSSEEFDSISWILDEPVINFSQSVVDETIKLNVEMHYNLGLTPKLVITLAGDACEWCKAMAGVFDYPDVPDGVYRRHQRCRCTVEYNPGDGKRQDVYSKKWL